MHLFHTMSLRKLQPVPRVFPSPDGSRWVGLGEKVWFFNGIFRLQDGAPRPYYEVDLSLVNIIKNHG